MKKKKRLLKILGLASLALLGISTLLGAIGFIYVTLISSQIDERMAQLRSTQTSRLYALFPSLEADRAYPRKTLETVLASAGYTKAKALRSMDTKQFYWEGPRSLHVFRPSFSGSGYRLSKDHVKISLSETFEIESITSVDSLEELDKFDLSPKQLGFYFAGRLRNQHSIALSEIPVSLRLAFIAIEDVRFLEHHGVSFRGTVRALWKDLIAMKWVQGGSTITQQLMKNLFFSREKVLTRKLKEALYAFVAESRFEKETILEAYLNEVYLGQWNTHEIHGVSEAARYYFNRSVFDLGLKESATLAAIIQGPALFNPHKNPEKVLKRRNVVLEKMASAGFILQSEYEKAIGEPLGVTPPDRELTDAAYFMELAMRDLPASVRERLDEETLSVYLTLNPILQNTASEELSKHIERMENYYKNLKEKRDAGKPLQGAVVAIDVPNCAVVALQGGRNFREAPFNRAINGKRQPGSLFKPFVYLSALTTPPDDQTFDENTLLEDEPFEWKYDRQTWSPKNYDNTFRGQVRFSEALENSLNVPTARLAQMVGIKNIVSNLKKSGVESKLPPLPSISLGSAEVTPFELATAYTTLARIGNRCVPRSYWAVYDTDGKEVITNKLVDKQALDSDATFATVSMLKGVFARGTAVSAQNGGFDLSHMAGKTGTTNDYKDAWFVGFSPELLVLVWVGYDSEDNVEFPGAVAALPVWTNIMKVATPFLKNIDFNRTPASYSPNEENGYETPNESEL